MKKMKSCGINVILKKGFIIGNPENLVIDDHVYIGPYAYLFCRGGLEIGKNVILGPKVNIHTTNHNYENSRLIPYDEISYLKPVVIEDNVWIGANTLVAPGVTIREGGVVAMGSVVVKSTPPNCVVGGNPARVLKELSKSHYEDLKGKNKLYLREKYFSKIESRYV